MEMQKERCGTYMASLFLLGPLVYVYAPKFCSSAGNIPNFRKHDYYIALIRVKN